MAGILNRGASCAETEGSTNTRRCCAVPTAAEPRIEGAGFSHGETTEPDASTRGALPGSNISIQQVRIDAQRVSGADPRYVPRTKIFAT